MIIDYPIYLNKSKIHNIIDNLQLDVRKFYICYFLLKVLHP